MSAVCSAVRVSESCVKTRMNTDEQGWTRILKDQSLNLQAGCAEVQKQAALGEICK
jgi:hypothetical protein